MASLTSVLETALYVADLDQSIQFYTSLFDLAILEQDKRLCALNVAGRQVLLLFRKGSSAIPMQTTGGTIPPHDGAGQLHLAFAIPKAELNEWRQRLLGMGIAIESEVSWPRGGHSLYFRDPDKHLIELATPGLWAIY